MNDLRFESSMKLIYNERKISTIRENAIDKKERKKILLS